MLFDIINLKTFAAVFVLGLGNVVVVGLVAAARLLFSSVVVFSGA